VVQAIAHPKGGKRLVAYVVLDAVNDDSPLTMDETHQAEGNVLELLAEQAPSIANRVVPQRLSDYLSKKVPDYMIPADYVLLDELPLTPNGKIDRRALPVPEEVSTRQKHQWVAPRTEAEQQLAALWCQVLGREEVGIYDNFFEVGGDSLLVTRLIPEIRRLFHLELPLNHLYEKNTIASLAQFIQTMAQTADRLRDTSNLTSENREAGEL
jgi:acyl carrier protein